MKRLELSERDMEWLDKAVWYYWHRLCVERAEATEAVVEGMKQPYTVDDYIQIWKLSIKVHNQLNPPNFIDRRLTPTDIKRIRHLYGKGWRGEESWQAFARDQKKKHDRWDDEEIEGKRK